MSRGVVAFVGLGSNLGDRLRALREAVTRISSTKGIVVQADLSVASLYESEPLGGPPHQGKFLNSALRLETSLEPATLMRAILGMEAAMGRRRRVRWEDRAIDLDLLLYSDYVLESVELTLPHPRMHQRRFVLEPLAEVAGTVVHPVLRQTISELAFEMRDSSDQKLVRIMGPEWPTAA